MIYKKNVKPQKKSKKRKNSNDRFFESTTKVFVTSSLLLSWICIIMSYVLCFMNKESTAIALSKNIANILLGTLLPYLLKSFFETYCSERNKKEVQLLKLKYKLGLDSSSIDDSEPIDVDEE